MQLSSVVAISLAAAITVAMHHCNTLPMLDASVLEQLRTFLAWFELCYNASIMLKSELHKPLAS